MVEIGKIHAEIRFDSGTLERLFAEPEKAVADAEAFWEAEEPMRYAKRWHEAVGVPVDLDRFRTIAGEIAALPANERAAHPALLMTRQIMAEEGRFLALGLPHLCSLLPDNPATLDIKILFAGGLRANAFACVQVVVNATSPFWHVAELSIDDRASWVLNLLVHECWHGGYCENQERWTEEPLADEVLSRLLVNIQNEGIATYVNYTARSLFPAKADQDFAMLDDPAAVARKLEAMNAILAKRHDLDDAAMRDLAWNEGVLGRAFYVGGAHMARVLDERAGRRALTDTIATGPMSFVAAYNAVADEALGVPVARA
jgi:hypothetical protein